MTCVSCFHNFCLFLFQLVSNDLFVFQMHSEGGGGATPPKEIHDDFVATTKGGYQSILLLVSVVSRYIETSANERR